MEETPLFDVGEVGITRYSLTRLCGEIARSLARLGRVVVEGEVVRPLTRPSGWTYFTLADRTARLPVACPAVRARRCRDAVHGTRVAVSGSLVFSARNGQLQLEAEEVVPVGQGAIQAAIARTRELLASEGILDRPRRPLPTLPRAIGVICGAEAAVRGDIESVVADRFPGYPVVFRQVTVSGTGAVDAIVRALRFLSRQEEVEVVIVARGGGDPASLLPFSDEDVCREIAACPLPVVTAIGHERDRPLCDEVSDLACNTPSLAAVRVVPSLGDLRERLDDLLDEIRQQLSAGVSVARDRLGRIEPAGSLDGRVAGCRSHLGATAATLEALSPRSVLRRGYAVVRDPRGMVVRRPDDVSEGERIEVEVAGGAFAASVAGGLQR